MLQYFICGKNCHRGGRGPFFLRAKQGLKNEEKNPPLLPHQYRGRYPTWTSLSKCNIQKYPHCPTISMDRKSTTVLPHFQDMIRYSTTSIPVSPNNPLPYRLFPNYSKNQAKKKKKRGGYISACTSTVRCRNLPAASPPIFHT